MKSLFFPTPSNRFRAGLLTRRFLAVYAAILVLANIFFMGASQNTTFASLDVGSLVSLHNSQRSAAGLGSLTLNSKLSNSAAAKARVMLSSDCWSHYCGGSPWNFFSSAGYSYIYAGENLAEGFTDNSAVMQAWMNSSTHRANILKPEFTEIGIAMVTGYFQGRENNTIIVAHFGTPKAVEQPKTTSPVVKTNTQVNTKPPVTESPPPTITSPDNGSVLTTKTPEIKGKYDKDVQVTVNKEESGRISPEGGIFTYNPSLVDGEYESFASDFAEQSKKSATVKFKIDTTPPDVDIDSIEIQELAVVDSGYVYQILLPSNEGIDDIATLVFDINGEETKAEEDGEGNLVVFFSTETLNNADSLTIKAKDAYGNEQIYPLNLRRILGDTSISDNFVQTSGNISEQGVNPRVLISILAVIGIIALLGLEIYEMRKYKNQHIKVASKPHLHIAAMILLLLILLIGNLYGSV